MSFAIDIQPNSNPSNQATQNEFYFNNQLYKPLQNLNLLQDCPSDLQDIAEKLIKTDSITLDRKSGPLTYMPQCFDAYKNKSKKITKIDILDQNKQVLLNSENLTFEAQGGCRAACQCLTGCGLCKIIKQNETVLKRPDNDQRLTKSKITINEEVKKYNFNAQTNLPDMGYDGKYVQKLSVKLANGDNNFNGASELGHSEFILCDVDVIHGSEDSTYNFDRRVHVNTSDTHGPTGGLRYIVKTNDMRYDGYVSANNEHVCTDKSNTNYIGRQQLIFTIKEMQFANNAFLSPENLPNAPIVGNLTCKYLEESTSYQYTLKFPKNADWKLRLQLIHYTLYQEQLISDNISWSKCYRDLLIVAVGYFLFIAMLVFFLPEDGSGQGYEDFEGVDEGGYGIEDYNYGP